MKIWKSYDGGAPKNKITENGPFIDDLPVINGDFPQLCKRLPEGDFDFPK